MQVKPILRRLMLPGVLIAIVAAVWLFGLTNELSWSGLARRHAALRDAVAAHPFAAPCLFVVIYVVSVTLSLPQAALLTLAGGLLFGTVLGGALAVTGGTAGAVCLFLIARSAFGDLLTGRGGIALTTLRDELRRDGFFYLLAVRLVPVVPFWLVNLAAALCGMRLRHFAAATFIGVMPATFIYASVGSGLGDVLARGDRPDLSVLFSWPVLGPLLALAALSLLPAIWRIASARREVMSVRRDG